MKAIDYAMGLKRKLTNNLAPISKGEMNLLVDMLEKEQAQKPTVVIQIGSGCLLNVTSSCEVVVILADFDIFDTSGQRTPNGGLARVAVVSVDVCPDEISTWLALANQA